MTRWKPTDACLYWNGRWWRYVLITEVGRTHAVVVGWRARSRYLRVPLDRLAPVTRRPVKHFPVEKND